MNIRLEATAVNHAGDIAMRHLSFLFVLAACATLHAAAQPLQQPLRGGDYDSLAVNNLTMWMSNDGDQCQEPVSVTSGLRWPKGSRTGLVFTDGILLAGIRDGDAAYVTGSTYTQGMIQGGILPDGNPGDPQSERYRLWNARRVTRDEYSALPVAQQDELAADVLAWPVDLGAPWVDGNANGVYDPDFEAWLDGDAGTDTPLRMGDQVLWCVMNDLDETRMHGLYGSDPIGIELRTMAWAWGMEGCPWNVVFTRHTFINRGATALHDAYVAQWSDTDLGEPFDDFLGVDTTLNLAYTYNAFETDGQYGDPPAMGYLALQGPVAPDPSGVALYDFGLRAGYRNLPVSAFVYYVGGSSVYRDPDIGAAEGAEQTYSNCLGRTALGGAHIDPVSGSPTRFCLSGDPVLGTGWIDGMVNSPGDRRWMLSMGPFDFAPGDTQQVVIARIVAQGSDRLSDVQELRNYAACVKQHYTSLFITGAPPPPVPPETMVLGQQYPQPFGPRSASAETTIPFTLPRRTHVTLRAYDLLGREVAEIARREYEAGSHSAVFRPDPALSPGVYVIELRAGSERRQRTCVVW
jgi:hypothetical protein